MKVNELLVLLNEMESDAKVLLSVSTADYAVEAGGVEYDDDGFVVIHCGGN